jgi:hypothetical protein
VLMLQDDLRTCLACSVVEAVGQGPWIVCEKTDCGHGPGLRYCPLLMGNGNGINCLHIFTSCAGLQATLS